MLFRSVSQSRYGRVFRVFGDGFISGFTSNAVTVLINTFVTTGKRVVRLIREGILSLLKALKMLVLPPEGLTFSEAAHESMKLLAAGGIVVGGVALEESVELLIKSVPVLIPYASVLTAVFVGALTALCMTFVCYLIDPRWRRDSDNGEFSWDNRCFSSLLTDNNRVYILQESQCLV